nr:PqiC family protein [uncultured Cupriavidus sp.]
MTIPWHFQRALWLIVLMAAVLGTTGCASPEPRYFTLAGPVESDAVGECRRDSSMPPLRIEVQPIRVPERLNRTNVLVRTGDAVHILENDRWSAPFPDEFRDALSERLQDSLGACERQGSGPANSQEHYRISVDIVQVDADPDMPMGAVVNWRIRRVPDGRLQSGQSRVVLPASGSVRGLVRAYQRVVAAVAGDLCTAVSRMQ